MSSSVTQENGIDVPSSRRHRGTRGGVLVRNFHYDGEDVNLEYQGVRCSESDEGDVSFEGDGLGSAVEAHERCGCGNDGREGDMVRSSGSSAGREVGRKGVFRQSSGVLVEEEKDKGEGETEEQVMFSCNICHELASEPVVTLCGHLYCWPCLYKWLQVQSNYRTCPVCKAGVDRDKVIPVYGRGGNEDPRAKRVETVVPSRPTGQRPQPVDTRNGLIVGGAQAGVFPSIFGFSSGTTYQDHLTPEQQHQAFLSRLLLMLGSFVIMCLLLF